MGGSRWIRAINTGLGTLPVVYVHYVRGMKTCTKCQQAKPLSDYYTERRKGRPDTPMSRCRECWNAYVRQRAARPENRAKTQAAYKAKCLRLGETSLSKPWAEKTPEQRARAYESVKAWRAANPTRAKEEARLSLRLRRSLAFQSAWPAICERYGNVCLACHQSKPLVFDHVVPFSKGGENTLTNGQPLCRGCNGGKGQTGDGCRDYRPDHGEWIRELVRENPGLGEGGEVVSIIDQPVSARE